jgi:hypothetical protein
MRLLLEEEGVEFDAQERVDLQRFGWWPDRETAEDGGRNVMFGDQETG